MSTSERARPPEPDDVHALDRWLAQLAGQPAAVDVGSVRRRARRVRRVRAARHLAAVAGAFVAALALSQSMIGGAAREPIESSAGEVAADLPADAGEAPAATPRARPAAPGTSVPRPDRSDGSWDLVPLVAVGGTSAAWARDRAFDLVTPPVEPIGSLDDGVARGTAQRVTSW